MAQYIFSVDGNYVNFNGGGNLWRLHKDSRCVAWHWDQTGDLFFDVYDQKYIVKAGNIGDVTVGGNVLTTAADFETHITDIFPGLAGGGGGSSYLVYTALLTQSGTSAPVATVLENTLGGTVVWTREAAGDYIGTLAGAFPVDKTYIAPFGDWGGAANTYITIWDAGVTVLGYMTMFRESDNVIGLQINDNTGGLVDYSTLLGATKISLPEIRVYP